MIRGIIFRGLDHYSEVYSKRPETGSNHAPQTTGRHWPFFIFRSSSQVFLRPRSLCQNCAGQRVGYTFTLPLILQVANARQNCRKLFDFSLCFFQIDFPNV